MENRIGIHPTGDMILVAPLIAPKMLGSIALPDESWEKDQQAQMFGILVEAGDAAWDHPRLKGVTLGTLVYFAKWAGTRERDPDGNWWKIMRAGDIIGWKEGPGIDPIGARSVNEVFGLNEAPGLTEATA